MKILYGIQGTGNGHLTRARILARHFSESDIEVTYLVSGRDADKFFAMEIFGNYLHRRGLTFHSENGAINYYKTAYKNNPLQFITEVLSLDVKQYDLIITDFEPVSAWAGKIHSVPVLGIGHQYAFEFAIPVAGESLLAKTVMRYFAPAKTSLGLHWHHFDSPILPPVFDTHLTRQAADDEKMKILVYLAFEEQTLIQQLLAQFPHYQFILYAPQYSEKEIGNLSLRGISLAGFKQDLQSADAVICNSGFELISECLQLGLPALVKPVHKQMEQLSNSKALATLNYATTCQTLTFDVVNDWLNSNRSDRKITFPDVGKAIVEWLSEGRQESLQSLSSRLWQQVKITK